MDDKTTDEKPSYFHGDILAAEANGRYHGERAMYMQMVQREQGAFVWGYVIGIGVGVALAMLIFNEGFPHV